MRTAAKVDGNHGEVLDALNDFPGMKAISTAQLGKGKPDILAAFRLATCWFEVKQPGEKPNAAQIDFMAKWPGKVYVVSTGEEAVRLMVEAARPAGQHGCMACEGRVVCVCGGAAQTRAGFEGVAGGGGR